MRHHQNESLCIYFSLALSSRESLFLRSVVRTRLQFVVLAGIAVEVNDLLGLIAFFGHSASPSETIRAASAFWLATAEAPASQVASASCYRLPENVFFFSVVESELKFVQVQRQIFLADTVVRTDDPALQHRPEVVQILRVNDAAHVFFGLVINGVVRIADALQASELSAFIGRDQFYFLGIDYLANESLSLACADVFDHLTNHIALARDCADDWNLAALSPSDGSAFGLVHLAALAADESFIDFHDAHELTKIGIAETSAEPMAHIEGGFVRTGINHPMDLQGADSLLGHHHQMQNLEPRPERVVRILENRSDIEREAIRGFAALVAGPMIGTLHASGIHFLIAAPWASDAVRPALMNQIFLAGCFVRKHPVELRKAHLFYDLWFLFVLSHNEEDTTDGVLCQVRYSCQLVHPLNEGRIACAAGGRG